MVVKVLIHKHGPKRPKIMESHTKITQNHQIMTKFESKTHIQQTLSNIHQYHEVWRGSKIGMI